MNISKTLTIFALSAAILGSGCSVGTTPQEVATADLDQPRAEMVIEDAYNPVHGAGYDAIQKETNAAGIGTMAPTEILETLSSPSVEGNNDVEMQSKTFSARFESANGNSSYEVVCTSDGVGSGLAGGSGDVHHLSNGIILQQTGLGRYSSDWVKTGNGSSCQVTSQGMTLNQTIQMSSSLQTFAPDYSGALIAN